MKELIIVGLGETASIAFEYFTYDSEYQVVAFVVSREFKNVDFYLGLPVHELETINEYFSSERYHAFVAISGGKCNQDRKMVYELVKSLGYKCASYISSKAYVAESAVVGENCLVMENSSVQYNAMVGNNVIVWNGVQLCHSSKLADHVYIAPGSVLCGFVRVGENTFLGANLTVVDDVTIGSNCFVSAHNLIKQNIEDNVLVKSNGESLFDIDITLFDSQNFYKAK